MDHMAFGRSEGLISCLVWAVLEWFGGVGTTYLIFIYLICCGSTPQQLLIPKRYHGNHIECQLQLSSFVATKMMLETGVKRKEQEL